VYWKADECDSTDLARW